MSDLKLPKSTRGGARPGAGRPKGPHLPTLERKEAAKEILRELVLDRLAPLVRAQIDSAMGISHFMLRDPETGQFRRLTDEKEIEAALNAPGAAEGSTYWIYTKDPQTPAFTTLMDRATGKPIDEMRVEHKGEIGLVDVLRQRKGKIGVSRD